MGIVLTRKRLYEQVWQEPMGELSRRLGVPSAKLREACKTMAVPVPALAHWGAVKAGRESPRATLPPHDGPAQVRFGGKEKESLADWVARAAPSASVSPAPAAASLQGPRLIPLHVWANNMFGEHAPHANTLLRWTHEGRIQPQPRKISRRWWVSPGAEYCAD